MNRITTLWLIFILGMSVTLGAAQALDEDQLAMLQYKLPASAVPDSILAQKDTLTYMDGQLFTGTSFSYYAGKHLKQICQYHAGLKQGVSYIWYPDGKPEMLANYDRGRLNGRFKGWYQYGAVIYDLVLKASQFAGDSQYNADETRAAEQPADTEPGKDGKDQSND